MPSCYRAIRESFDSSNAGIVFWKLLALCVCKIIILSKEVELAINLNNLILAIEIFSSYYTKHNVFFEVLSKQKAQTTTNNRERRHISLIQSNTTNA